jgi:hypothetical protein
MGVKDVDVMLLQHRWFTLLIHSSDAALMSVGRLGASGF